MIRVAWFLFKLAAVVAAAIWVADRSGRVSIEWRDMIVETSAALLVAVVALLMLATYYLTRLADTLRTTPRIYRMHRALSHQRQGQHLLSEALDALSLEKNRKATGLLRRAEKLLGPSHIVDLVKSRAGVEKQAMPLAMADFSSPYAWRSAIEQQLKAGHPQEAMLLAENFARKHPGLALPRKLLCDVYLQQGEWERALALLDEMRASGPLPRKEIRQLRAAVFAERAREANAHGQYREAFEWALQADRLHPTWPPALMQMADALAGQDKPREAISLIAKSWAQGAHDQLADRFLALKHAKNPLALAQEAEKLGRRAPSHAATHWLLANAFFGARLYGQANRHAEALVENGKGSHKAALLLARIAEAESNRPQQAEWRKKAESMLPDALWICRSCRQAHQSWQARCAGCHGFNTLEWSQPVHATAPRLVAAGEGVKG